MPVYLSNVLDVNPFWRQLSLVPSALTLTHRSCIIILKLKALSVFSKAVSFIRSSRDFQHCPVDETGTMQRGCGNAGQRLDEYTRDHN